MEISPGSSLIRVLGLFLLQNFWPQKSASLIESVVFGAFTLGYSTCECYEIFFSPFFYFFTTSALWKVLWAIFVYFPSEPVWVFFQERNEYLQRLSPWINWIYSPKIYSLFWEVSSFNSLNLWSYSLYPCQNGYIYPIILGNFLNLFVS